MSKAYKRAARLNGSGTQYGSLAWRRAGGGVEVLLITSRETRRWTIPKGWPMKRLNPGEAAAREAFEEAGVEGTSGAAIGAFRYDKRLRDGAIVICTVEVFPMEVATEHAQWREQAERERAWFSPIKAASLVNEPELKALILGFEP